MLSYFFPRCLNIQYRSRYSLYDFHTDSVQGKSTAFPHWLSHSALREIISIVTHSKENHPRRVRPRTKSYLKIKGEKTFYNCTFMPRNHMKPFLFIQETPNLCAYTAKTQYRIFETNISRKGTARLKSQFLHWAIFIFLWSVCLFCCRKLGGPNVGIYSTDRSQSHRHINLEIGTEAAQFLFWEYINPNFFSVYMKNHYRTALHPQAELGLFLPGLHLLTETEWSTEQVVLHSTAQAGR